MLLITSVVPAIPWLVVSSIIGGVIGASIKFAFEDLLSPAVGWRRETRRVVAHYVKPIVRAGEALERRINGFVRNRDAGWFEDDEWIRFGLLYAFGEHLAWVRILERRFGFLPFEASRKGRVFNDHLYGVFRALNSHYYFRGGGISENALVSTALPRAMLTAIGEVMIDPDHEDRVLDFTEFARRYVDDAQFRQWFSGLLEFLHSARPGDPIRWDRLILAQAELQALIRYLDPDGALVRRRDIENLELLQTTIAAERIRQRYRQLAPTSSADSAGRSRPLSPA
jgi:hypothetical protein